MSGPCPIAALGYVGIEVADVAAWTGFARDMLGLQVLPAGPDATELRMDDHAARLRLHAGPRDDIAYAGWEVRDEAALVGLAARLEGAGVAVTGGDAALAAARRVAGLISFEDPDGIRHEAFFGPLQRTEVPFVSPLGVRFVTGRQGLGHIVLRSSDPARSLAFWRDLLGFRLSDTVDAEFVPGRPVSLAFLRCNGRHHSLALAPVPTRKALVHLMLEVDAIDDVGRALDRCLAAGIHLSMTLGRHSNDRMLSFYPLTPSGFDVEYGWGGVSVDDETWHVLRHETASAWGHRFQRPPRREPA